MMLTTLLRIPPHVHLLERSTYVFPVHNCTIQKKERNLYSRSPQDTMTPKNTAVHAQYVDTLHGHSSLHRHPHASLYSHAHTCAAYTNVFFFFSQAHACEVYALICHVQASKREHFLKQTFRLSHKGVKTLSYVYKTESMNITRRRGKETATTRHSQRLPLPLAVGLAFDLDFAGALFFGRSESSESSPFT